MARLRKKNRNRNPRCGPGSSDTKMADVTPERLAKGDDYDFVNPALIDPRQPIGRARRFRVSALDRLHKRGRIDWVHWYAGDCYRTAWHRAGQTVSVVASYGEPTSRSDPAYGLPRTVSQLRARQYVRDCRARIVPELRPFMDRLLIEDSLPVCSGRQAARQLDAIRLALDAMARWMRLPAAA